MDGWIYSKTSKSSSVKKSPTQKGGVTVKSPVMTMTEKRASSDPLPGDIENHGQPIQVRGFSNPRCRVLRDTLARLATPELRAQYQKHAQRNIVRWAREAAEKRNDDGIKMRIEVSEGDWGEVTQELTKRFGTTFASLNMANAKSFGGAYHHGAPAQEENMFRRTDCHFHDEGFNRAEDTDGSGSWTYTTEMQNLISGAKGRVYLDTEEPRVCIKGQEVRTESSGGVSALKSYRLLNDDEIFSFYELRSAAVDMRGVNTKYDETELEKRITAQLETCVDKGVQHVVLSAFGCGAFQNPAEIVAAAYRNILQQERYQQHFRVVAFAVFHAGYGPKNFPHFRDAFAFRTESSAEDKVASKWVNKCCGSGWLYCCIARDGLAQQDDMATDNAI